MKIFARSRKPVGAPPQRRGAGVAIVFALLVAPAVARQGVDRLLPEDTLVAISVDDLSAYTKSLEKSPLAQVLGEEEVQKFLEKPKAFCAEALAKMSEEVKKQPGFENFDLSPAELLAGSYGRMFVALTHVGMPNPEAGMMMPDIGLVIGIERREGAPDWQALLKDLIARGVAASGAPLDLKFEKTSKNGHEYEQLVGGPEMRPPVLFAESGNLQLISLSHDSLGGILDRAAGKEGGKSLAANKHYQKAQSKIAIDSPASIRFFFNTDLGLKALTEGIKLALQAEGETQMVALVDKLFAKSGLMALKCVAGANQCVDGVAHSRSWAGVEGPLTGLLALQPDQPIDLAHLAMVPKDSASFWITQFDFGRLYDFALECVKEVDADVYEEMQGAISGFSAQVGGEGQPLDIRKDLLGNIGPEQIFLQPQSNNPMVPAMLMLFEVRNGSAVTDALQKLAAFGSTASDGQVALKAVDYKETKLYQVDFSGEVPIPLNPCFTVANGYLMFALSPGDLKRQLRLFDKPGESITANPDYQRFAGKLPKDGKLNSLAYTDIRGAVESGYGQVTTFLPMLTMAGDFELPFDMNLLPEQETISKHLFGSLSYSTSGPDGGLSESFSSIGAEILGGVAMVGVVAGAVAFGTMARAVPEPQLSTAQPTERAAESPADAARSDLNNLKASITIFRLEKGALPDRLEQLLEPTTSYPKGCLGEDALPVDPWGNAYQFAREGNGYKLWSFGQNGQDDAGAADDILVVKK